MCRELFYWNFRNFRPAIPNKRSFDYPDWNWPGIWLCNQPQSNVQSWSSTIVPSSLSHHHFPPHSGCAMQHQASGYALYFIPFNTMLMLSCLWTNTKVSPFCRQLSCWGWICERAEKRGLYPQGALSLSPYFSFLISPLLLLLPPGPWHTHWWWQSAHLY